MRLPLHVRVLIGLAPGAAGGLLAPALLGGDSPVLKTFLDKVAKPVGEVFLALLFMIVVPLVFSAPVMGMQELGQARRFGRVGGLSPLMTAVL